MGTISQHLELGDVSVYISKCHFELVELIMGFLLFHIVHEGLAEVSLQDWLRVFFVEIIGVLFNFVQPIIVALDPSSNVGASNETHEVGALLEGVSSNGRVMIHDHKSFKSSEEVKGLATIAIEVF